MDYEKEYFEANYGVDNIADANIEFMVAEEREEQLLDGSKKNIVPVKKKEECEDDRDK